MAKMQQSFASAWGVVKVLLRSKRQRQTTEHLRTRAWQTTLSQQNNDSLAKERSAIGSGAGMNDSVVRTESAPGADHQTTG